MGSWYVGRCAACGFKVETGYERDVQSLGNQHAAKNAVLGEPIRNHGLRWTAFHEPITRQEVLLP